MGELGERQRTILLGHFIRRFSSRTHTSASLYVGRRAFAISPFLPRLPNMTLSYHAREIRNLTLTALQIEALACQSCYVSIIPCSILLLCFPFFSTITVRLSLNALYLPISLSPQRSITLFKAHPESNLKVIKAVSWLSYPFNPVTPITNIIPTGPMSLSPTTACLFIQAKFASIHTLYSPP